MKQIEIEEKGEIIQPTFKKYDKNNTHCNFSRLQCGSFSRSESNITPETPGLFQLTSSSLMCEGFSLRAETRASKPSSPMLQLYSLQRNREKNFSYLHNYVKSMWMRCPVSSEWWIAMQCHYKQKDKDKQPAQDRKYLTRCKTRPSTCIEYTQNLL